MYPTVLNSVTVFGETIHEKIRAFITKINRRMSLQDIESIAAVSEVINQHNVDLYTVTATNFCRVLISNSNLIMAFGRRYGLVGRNGLGKTTLLRAISRYDHVSFI